MSQADLEALSGRVAAIGSAIADLRESVLWLRSREAQHDAAVEEIRHAIASRGDVSSAVAISVERIVRAVIAHASVAAEVATGVCSQHVAAQADLCATAAAIRVRALADRVHSSVSPGSGR